MCPLARAAEIVAERWTLLVIRELSFSSWRFSDLRRRLGDVSPSVLTERPENLEIKGLIVQCELLPPAASSVYDPIPGSSHLPWNRCQRWWNGIVRLTSSGTRVCAFRGQ